MQLDLEGERDKQRHPVKVCHSLLKRIYIIDMCLWIMHGMNKSGT